MQINDLFCILAYNLFSWINSIELKICVSKLTIILHSALFILHSKDRRLK